MTRRESDWPAGQYGRWFLPGRWQCIARGSVGSPPLIGSWATARNGGRHKAMRPGRGLLAEWHMLPSCTPCIHIAVSPGRTEGLGLATLRLPALSHPGFWSRLPDICPLAGRALYWDPTPVRIACLYTQVSPPASKSCLQAVQSGLLSEMYTS